MFNYLKKSGVLLILAATVAACSHLAPIENVQSAAIPTNNHLLSLKEIGGVIAKAAIGRGWTVTQAGPNKLHAHILRHDTYVADVNITYSQTSYSINLASSQNLDQANGQISSSYNRYIDYLRMDIDKGLNQAQFD